MPEIIVPGGTRAGIGFGGSKGYQKRIDEVRKSFGYIPAWRVDRIDGKASFYVCGECFARHGDGPYTSVSEAWTAGAPGGKVVPERARCHDCGQHAWPKD